jgi:hypothetical protein
MPRVSAAHRHYAGQVGAELTPAGAGVLRAPAVLVVIEGVTAISQLDEEPE